MPGPLSSSLRNDLAKTVTAARRRTEDGARAALQTLAVDAASPHAGMSDADKALRRRLRARGRQLGDRRDAGSGTQAIDRLVNEIAYEHWHRLLFARFLAENDLLIHPELGQAITLDEVEELAREAGVDRHALAASYAQQSLPQIFRQGDPVLEVELAVEYRNTIQKLLADVPEAVFTAGDSLGWTYQYWQADQKDAVNASGVKIGADELPAVTQLFTEDYMVDFLLDNTLGAWWAGKVLASDPSIAATATSEEDLRKAVSLSGVPWDYLRFITDESGAWRPAAGTFDGWPKATKDLTCLDPCMGSGHFVVAMFERLVPMRMAEEGLSETAAIQAVVRDNLYGLEIDPRCTQIGAFNLALAAWRRVGHCPLPAMHIACSGLAPNATEDEWVALAEGNSRLEEGMRRLHGLFKDAPVLGSLINPRAEGYAAFEASFAELQPILEKAFSSEGSDDAEHEMAVTARGVAKAAEILGQQFTLVATNVPYLGRGRQPLPDDATDEPSLAAHCDKTYPDAKADLSTCFVDRCLTLAKQSGTAATVTPVAWLQLGIYKSLRKRLLRTAAWELLAKLGPHAFGGITGEQVNVALLVHTNAAFSKTQHIAGLDAGRHVGVVEKASALRDTQPTRVLQVAQLDNPDARVVTAPLTADVLLSAFCDSFKGLSSGDLFRFIQKFWEHGHIRNGWEAYQRGADTTSLCAGRDSVILFEEGVGQMRAYNASQDRDRRRDFQGAAAWGNCGVTINQMQFSTTLYSGEKYDENAAALIPTCHEDLPAIWAYVQSDEFRDRVRCLDDALKVTNKTLIKVPFDRERWQTVAESSYPGGLPAPHSADPTQWLFNGHPKDSDNPLHVAVARLVGYHWPRQTGSEFPDCPALGPDGLESHADEDGIVCLAPVKGETSAADRLRALLAAALGDAWSSAREREFLAAIAAANSTDKKTAKPAKSLEDWLRDDFFTEHCKLFHHRPFVWHIWDGQKRGFHCLVNGHRVTGPDGEGRKTLEAITYAYLGDWIDKQKADVASGKEGADALLAAAQHLQGELKKILDGEPPYDLFVRWKPLHEQAIGWEPDINDGVRLNIRPFMTAEPMSGGKKGAGILRTKPNIKWDKDRGKEPESIRPIDQFPWFYECPGATKLDADRVDWTPAKAAGKDFDGNRWNDLHYSNAVKKQAREDAAARVDADRAGTGGQS